MNCEKCGTEMVYADEYFDDNADIVQENWQCPNCGNVQQFWQGQQVKPEWIEAADAGNVYLAWTDEHLDMLHQSLLRELGDIENDAHAAGQRPLWMTARVREINATIEQLNDVACSVCQHRRKTDGSCSNESCEKFCRDDERVPETP